MEPLTRAEERLMQSIWELNGPFLVRDLVERLPDKPPYTTVSSVVRILAAKGFLGYKAYGRTHEYYPLVAREDYRRRGLQQLLEAYFDGSASSLLSFMAREEQLSARDLDELRNLLNTED